MRKDDALLLLGDYTADQWGLVTTPQATSLGVDHVTLLRLTESGHLDRVSHGVYLLTSARPPSHLSTRVAWLRLAPAVPAWQRLVPSSWAGVVSHASAARLLGLGDLPAAQVELLVPGRRSTRDPGVLLRVGAVAEDEVAFVEGLPTTTAARTITDLLRAHADGGHVGGVIADAVNRGLVGLDELDDVLTSLAVGYGLRNTTGREFARHLVEQGGGRLAAEDTRDQLVDARRSGMLAGVLAQAGLARVPAASWVWPPEAAPGRTREPGFGDRPGPLSSAALLGRLRTALSELDVPSLRETREPPSAAHGSPGARVAGPPSEPVEDPAEPKGTTPEKSEEP